MVEQLQECQLAVSFVCPAALLFRRRLSVSGRYFRAFGNLPRPDLWLPYVFTSPSDAVAAGFIEVSEPGKSMESESETRRND